MPIKFIYSLIPIKFSSPTVFQAFGLGSGDRMMEIKGPPMQVGNTSKGLLVKTTWFGGAENCRQSDAVGVQKASQSERVVWCLDCL